MGRESFGKGWFGDATAHLKLNESVECDSSTASQPWRAEAEPLTPLCCCVRHRVREFTADYGQLPDLTQTNPVRPPAACNAGGTQPL